MTPYELPVADSNRKSLVRGEGGSRPSRNTMGAVAVVLLSLVGVFVGLAIGVIAGFYGGGAMFDGVAMLLIPCVLFGGLFGAAVGCTAFLTIGLLVTTRIRNRWHASDASALDE